MTREQVKEILDRVLTWPPERQADVAHVVELMEKQDHSTLGLAGEQLAGRLNDRHAAAETAEKLSKLETDVAAAEDQQVVGNGIQFHDGGVVQKWSAIQTIQPGTRGTGAGIDEDVLG